MNYVDSFVTYRQDGRNFHFTLLYTHEIIDSI